MLEVATLATVELVIVAFWVEVTESGIWISIILNLMLRGNLFCVSSNNHSILNFWYYLPVVYFVVTDIVVVVESNVEFKAFTEIVQCESSNYKLKIMLCI